MNLPPQRKRFTRYETDLDYLYQLRKEEPEKDTKYWYCGLFTTSCMGLPFLALPRELKEGFIERLWDGEIVRPFIHQAFDDHENDDFSGMILDGVQQLSVLDAYWSNEFEVFGCFWSELSVKEQRRFRKVVWPRVEFHGKSIDEIQEAMATLA